VIRIYHYEGIIFDLDGVITQTANLHSVAWKKMFDDYLHLREKRDNEVFVEFTHQNDYLPFVDGKPRYKGVRSFLESRNIELPYGETLDSIEKETICGLGNRKNKYINEILERDGVKVFDSTIKLILSLKSQNIKIGVASSSKNCLPVLKAANITHLFETRVDGVTSAELGLKGKPEPDIFTTACDNLHVSYDRAIIVEDAVSGVQAGFNGHFGLVIGVARENNERSLLANGADIVVSDLAEIDIDKLEKWFTEGLPEDNWHLRFFDYDPSKERTREALCTIGNGYFGTRGVNFENCANSINYPGTYIAGVYNELESNIDELKIKNEDLVNCPNWIPITFKIEDGKWFDLNSFQNNSQGKIIQYERGINFKTGIYSRTIIVEQLDGDQTKIISKRCASMANPHLGLIEYHIIPQNYSKRITIKSYLDGSISNSGVPRYSSLNSRHLEFIHSSGENNISYLLVKTNQSNIHIAEVAKLQLSENGNPISPILTHTSQNLKINSICSIILKEKQDLSVHKIVSIFTNQQYDVSDPLRSGLTTIENVAPFDNLIQNHKDEWAKLWNSMGIEIVGDRLIQKLIRLHEYHILTSASLHNQDFDFGILARGLSGESYRGHIFWDEIFILPFFNGFFPDVSRSSLMYRYRRLEAAKINAEQHGYKGAMYPWQSGLNGFETTQKIHLNPISGKWGPDHSYLQKHVSLAIAYNVWNYYASTNDSEFLFNYGAEMFFEISKFWTSSVIYNKITERYDIKDVVGPDEFHEKLPNSPNVGLTNNAYTNFLVVWLLHRSFDILELMEGSQKSHFLKRMQISMEEIAAWREISQKLTINFSSLGIIEQFEGYFNLEELDWDHYRITIGKIERLDRILKAENKDPNQFKVAKQADALMIFYLFSINEINQILNRMGYPITEDVLKWNYDYYITRTSHGSTLSRVVHSKLAEQLKQHSFGYKLYLEALTSDIFDIQGGTTGEGIHTGVMASTIMGLINIYAGVRFVNNSISITPNLPVSIRSIRFKILHKQISYNLEIMIHSVKIKIETPLDDKVSVFVYDSPEFIRDGQWYEFMK